MNKLTIIGNLTRDPEVRYTPVGSAVCEFGMAINRRFVSNGTERDETCFVEIVVWGKPAENCGRFLTKGSQVLVEGRLQYDQWEDRDTGTKRSRLRVVADQVQFMSRRDGEGQMGEGSYSAPGNGNAVRQNAGNGGQYGQGGNNGGYFQQRPVSNGPGGYQSRQQSRPMNNPGNGGMPPLPEDAFNVGGDIDDDIPF